MYYIFPIIPMNPAALTTPTIPPINYLNLEQDGMNKVQKLMETNNVNEDTLMAIIDGGNNQFLIANGRNMTYSEMRSMFG